MIAKFRKKLSGNKKGILIMISRILENEIYDIEVCKLKVSWLVEDYDILNFMNTILSVIVLIFTKNLYQ